MQDLKTGHLCHASPRAQFYGQLIGSSVSIIVTATAFILYNHAYTIPLYLDHLSPHPLHMSG